MISLAGALRLAFPELRTSDDAADRLAYARDMWPRHHLAVRAGQPLRNRPAAVVWPASTDEVARLVRWAHAEGVPLVPFGAGSGVCAGILPGAAAVVVDLKRMGRIRALDPRAPIVHVEAGTLGVPLERALGREGFTAGHFPSSILCSTVGGWIATRSAGQCSSAYGKIEDMVVGLECVTGTGEVVELRRRRAGPDLVPLVVGSEGTLAIVTRVSLRLHPAPTSRAFAAWSFPSMKRGWEALRAMMQSGLRPAIARLYDPFDAMLARHAVSKTGRDQTVGHGSRAPGLGGAALRSVLGRPSALNALLGSKLAARGLGGAMLIVIFEGVDDTPARDAAAARGVAGSMRGVWDGEGPARHWLDRRYAVSYRQAPLFAHGAFVDTMEVAARWSDVGRLHHDVRRALGSSVFVMAHVSHAYPDGCCIYFSFAGCADRELTRAMGWDAACEATYDRTWKVALHAAVAAGGTLAHHHGVGRSKAPRLRAELGASVAAVRGVLRAFDPAGILNPGNLLPGPADSPQELGAPAAVSVGYPPDAQPAGFELDRASLLVQMDGALELLTAERRLNEAGLTFDLASPLPAVTVAQWLAAGSPGAREHWRDPADQVVAGLEARLAGGTRVSIPPAPRRSVGPDLTALFVGAGGRFGTIDRAWIRVHRRGASRPNAAPFFHEGDIAPNEGENGVIDAVARALGTR